MKQKQIITIGGLINQGGVLVGAATELGDILGLHHNNQERIQSDLFNLVALTNDYASAKDELSKRKQSLKSLERDVCLHLRKSRDAVKPSFGYVYSDRWTVLGYRNSLEAPDKAADQTAFMEALRAFYANHPALELPTADLSAEATNVLLEALTQAQSAVASQQAVVKAAREERDRNARQMRTRVVALVQELKQLISPLDPRWLNFGFNMPGAIATPEPPTEVKVERIGAEDVALTWRRGARASHYRVFTKVHGVDGDFVSVASPSDCDCTIDKILRGVPVDIIVRSVNTAGESRPSAVLTVTIPPI
jgi:hypothetical protein